MKLENIAIKDENTPTDEVRELLGSASIIGLQTVDAENNIGKLSQMALSSYVTDTSIDNTKNIIEKLRKAKETVEEKYIKIRTKFDNIIPTSQDDINKYAFEEHSTNPIALKTAIDSINSTYISRSELQSIIDEVYATLWTTVSDMFTTCFQSSMYARQFTGAILGAVEENRTYAKITAAFEEPDESGD